MFSWLAPKRKPVIVAHRGSSATAPENTLAAFRRAIADGADAIELDVHLSKDNQVVVIHDATLRRTTNGRGRIKDYTYKELQQFSAGLWFDKRFSSEKIPLLQQVFNVVPKSVGLNIELKYTLRTNKTDALLERCIQIVREANRGDGVLLSSFHHSSIKKIQQIDSSLLTGCLYHPAAGSTVRAAKRSKADFLIVGRRYCTRRLVEKAHRHNFLVGVYTIDTKRQLYLALQSEADIIFTNEPTVILSF